jgi:hypothetical protein
MGLEPRFWPGFLDRLEPILRGSPVSMALETPDVPMDCGELMRAVLRRSVHFGTRYVQSKVEMNQWEIIRVDDRWISRCADFETDSRFVVVTAGPFATVLPIRNQLFPAEMPDLQQGVVGIINKRVCKRMLVFRDEASHFLNLIPFPNLTTINLGAKDVLIPDVRTARGVTDRDRDTIAGSLENYCPDLVRGYATISAHFYNCQKVGNNLPGNLPKGQTGYRHYFWRSGGNGLYYLYAESSRLVLQRQVRSCGKSENISISAICPGQSCRCALPTD